jgi:lipopolysaccharide biosynthesis regulator YciM
MVKVVLTMLMLGGIAAWGQAQNDNSAGAGKVDRADAYYHYAIAHLYAERAAASGSQTDADKAMEHFKAAVKADPSIPVTDAELSGIYKRRIMTPNLPPPRPNSK